MTTETQISNLQRAARASRLHVERERHTEVMRAMRTIARDAVARGLTAHGDVIEDVAEWSIGDDGQGWADAHRP